MLCDSICSDQGLDSIDLTTLDWWLVYIKNNNDCRELVGPGIFRFEGRFLAAEDTNQGSIGIQRRFDFLVWRTDGRIARLRPSQAKGNSDADEAHVVWTDDFAEWADPNYMRMAGSRRANDDYDH